MERSNLDMSFYFELLFNAEKLCFQEVSGITIKLKIEKKDSRAENRFKYKLPEEAKYENLVLKRGAIPANSVFLSWCNKILEGGLDQPIQPHDFKLNLLDASGSVLVSWEFSSAYPVKFSVSSFHSTGNDVAVETIEFAYNYFERSSIKI